MPTLGQTGRRKNVLKLSVPLFVRPSVRPTVRSSQSSKTTKQHISMSNGTHGPLGNRMNLSTLGVGLTSTLHEAEDYYEGLTQASF